MSVEEHCYHPPLPSCPWKLPGQRCVVTLCSYGHIHRTELVLLPALIYLACQQTER